MGVIFVILGALSFLLGYFMLDAGDTNGVALLLISSGLLIGAVIIDGINKIHRLFK
ncbi:hypothetical protein ACFL0T_03535 [Candidatus Omnitrophota bacterium]